MTDIEKKALALLNEVEPEIEPWTLDDIKGEACFETLCRAIEQHEAFRQEVSDEIVRLGCWPDTINLQRFIITKPVDPLFEVVQEWWETSSASIEETTDELRAAIAKRGGKIVWGDE